MWKKNPTREEKPHPGWHIIYNHFSSLSSAQWRKDCRLRCSTLYWAYLRLHPGAPLLSENAETRKTPLLARKHWQSHEFIFCWSSVPWAEGRQKQESKKIFQNLLVLHGDVLTHSRYFSQLSFICLSFIAIKYSQQTPQSDVSFKVSCRVRVWHNIFFSKHPC